MKIDDGVVWHWQDTKNYMVITWVIQTNRILVSTYSDRWAYKLRFKRNIFIHYLIIYLFIYLSSLLLFIGAQFPFELKL